MNREEWVTSTCAPTMLKKLYLKDPEYFATLAPILHRYFLACCWKIKHLIPQEGLRNGVLGTEHWLDGLVTDKHLWDLNWHAEAEAFGVEYAETPEEIAELRTLIDSIEELRAMPFEKARAVLLDAAYFAQGAMVYQSMKPFPFVKRLCASEFLCPNLLRQFLSTGFNE